MKIQGTVYRIISDAPDGRFYVYVGSTTQSLPERLQQHRRTYEAFTDKKHNRDCGSYKIVCKDHYEIVAEEVIEFDNIEQLLKAERRAYDKYSNDEDYINLSTYQLIN